MSTSDVGDLATQRAVELSRALEALRESEDRFRTAFDNSTLGKSLTAVDGRLLRVNRAFGDMLGYTADEMMTLNFADITHPDDLAESRECIRLLVAGERSIYRMQKRYLRRDGQIVWADVSTVLQRDAAGRPLHLITAIQDITERRKAQLALEASERSYRTLAENLPGLVYRVLLGEHRTMRFFNEMLPTLTGYCEGELAFGKVCSIEPLIVEADRLGVVAEVERAIAERRPFRVEYRLRRKDGVIRHFLEHGRPVSGADGSPAYLDGVILDVTERREAQAELRRLEWILTARLPRAGTVEEFSVVADRELTALNASRVILDAAGPELLAEIADDFLALLGTSSAIYEANGDYALGIFASGWCRFLDDASFRRCGTRDLRAALRSGRWLCHESCWADCAAVAIARGEEVDVECHGGLRLLAVPIRIGPEVIGAISVAYGDPPREPARLAELAGKYGVDPKELAARAQAYEPRPPYIIDLARRRLRAAATLLGEIIRRRRTETRLEQIVVELERSNRDLEQFAYVASHDLQEPLRMVTAYLQLLERRYRGRFDADADEFIRFAVDGATRMKQLITGLLDFSRIGSRAGARQRVSVQAAVDAALANLELAAAESRACVTCGPLPTVLANASQLTQLFQNLLDNAIKFRRDVPPEVRITAERHGPAWVFAVQDNGIGIDPRHFDRLFIVFRRLHGPERYPGTGIGLAICRKIVERHGGTITVESKPGLGSTFRFSWPAASDEIGIGGDE